MTNKIFTVYMDGRRIKGFYILKAPAAALAADLRAKYPAADIRITCELESTDNTGAMLKNWRY